MKAKAKVLNNKMTDFFIIFSSFVLVQLIIVITAPMNKWLVTIFRKKRRINYMKEREI